MHESVAKSEDNEKSELEQETICSFNSDLLLTSEITSDKSFQVPNAVHKMAHQICGGRNPFFVEQE